MIQRTSLPCRPCVPRCVRCGGGVCVEGAAHVWRSLRVRRTRAAAIGDQRLRSSTPPSLCDLQIKILDFDILGSEDW
jgi:hypothetical protein